MRRISWFTTALLLLLLSSAYSTAATVQVGTCKSGTVHFSTIQAAVNASPAGTTINICPGIYPEQVVVDKALSLKGITAGNSAAAVIVPPAGGVQPNTTSLATSGPIAAQLLVDSTNAVTISNLTVDGNNSGVPDCSVNLIGVFFRKSSGTITRSAVINQITSAPGCQGGLGIFAQSDGTPINVSITNNYVANYQKNGITANENGTTATITGNVVAGVGPTTGAAQNGIQIAWGGTGKINSNTVADDVWVGTGWAASGILIYAGPSVVTTGNTVTNTQYGIVYVNDTPGDADNGVITSNKVSATHLYDGIDLCNNGNLLQMNTVTGSDEAGIHLDSTCDSGTSGTGNTVSQNTINGACAGILLGNFGSVGANTYYNVTSKTMAGDACTPPLHSTKAGTGRHTFVAARP